MKRIKYQEVLETTKSTITLYNKLAQLEKDKKRDSKEYKDIFSSLERIVSIEKKKYEEQFYMLNGSAIYNEMISQNPSDFYFLEPNIDNLVQIRFLNHIKDGNIYILDGFFTSDSFISSSMKQSFQATDDLCFFITLDNFLKYENMSQEERTTIIDFKYALLAISNTLEDSFLSGKLLSPVTSMHMHKEELSIFNIYIIAKIQTMLNQLLSINDSQITVQTLPMILFIKSYLDMLEPDSVNSILESLKNFVFWNKLYGSVEEGNKDKILDMLDHILNLNSYQYKKLN